MISDNAPLRPGGHVLHPSEDWGVGQIQSVDGQRITCNFPHRGKVVINAAVVELQSVDINNIEESGD